MGADSYCYKTAYEADAEIALHNAREALLDSGDFPEGFDPFAMDEAAMEMAEAGGTGTILDIMGISTSPEIGAAAPLYDVELMELFGTTKPTESQVENNNKMYNILGRGDCRFLTLYDDNGAPKYTYFFGLSWD